ncbi:MAG: sigma 54-interacting transcriptional regulator [Candidatus Melainabacteria bacterium]|nr:sigma 54-interacting transcriptional regulator [Candidatus Melainabacteria bacterium]
MSIDTHPFFVGLCPSMRQVETRVALAAQTNATVLILGETGTGKDTVARSIHRQSVHKKMPLAVIDCTALPEEYSSFNSLGQTVQGTILLDEVGDLNSQMQAMLTRALKETENSKTNTRVIATSAFDLQSMMREGKFREDLFYRLNVIPILLPTLSERGSDIVSLAELFLNQANKDNLKELSNEAKAKLLAYDWPGNVRELQNLMYHLSVVVRKNKLDIEDLNLIRTNDNSDNSDLNYYNAISELEKNLFKKALDQANGSRTEAARLLGINRQLLYTKLKAHGLV